MMKNTILLFLVGLLVAGCGRELHVEFTPAKLVNLHYEKLYTNNDYTAMDYTRPDGDVIEFGKRSEVWPCTGDCVESGLVESIRFYKDAERKCFLFSVPNEEILAAFYEKQDKLREEFLRENDPARAEVPGYKENDMLQKTIGGVSVAIFKDGRLLAMTKHDIDIIKPSLRPAAPESLQCGTLYTADKK
jgi:hypothetical protein